MKRPIFFSDLDDTIFQTARKMQEGPKPSMLASEALNGSHSYMSDRQALMMEWLLNSTQFIPVTARSTEALGRCRLPFDSYQICSNGGVILTPSGEPDPNWHVRMKQQADNALDDLKRLMSFMSRKTLSGRFRYWIVEEFGTGFYFCVKSNCGADWLDEIDNDLSLLVDLKLQRHRNDNNLSFTPAGISKRSAVEYLSQKLIKDGRVPIFGMGDSLTDLPFMATCDMMVIPRNSQIHRKMLQQEKR